MLGGPSITTGIENPTTLALDGSGNLYVGNETTSSAGGISVYAAKRESTANAKRPNGRSQRTRRQRLRTLIRSHAISLGLL
jgi:hypothetical protein